MADIFSAALIKRTVRECLLVLLAYAHITACYQTLTREGNARNPHQKIVGQAQHVGGDDTMIDEPPSSREIFENLDWLDGPQAESPGPAPADPPPAESAQ